MSFDISSYQWHCEKIFKDFFWKLVGLFLFTFVIFFIPILFIYAFENFGQYSSSDIIYLILFYFSICTVFFLLLYVFPLIKITTQFLLGILPAPVAEIDIEKLLHKKGAAALRKSIRVIQNDKKTADIFSSKLGGPAYWPKKLEKNYPTSDRGYKLRLLVQIRLDELPKNMYLPSTGMLQFFVENVDYSIGRLFETKNPEELIKGSRHRVILHNEIDSTVVDIFEDVPKDEASFPIKKETAIDFVMEDQYMTFSDFRFPSIVGQKQFENILDQEVHFKKVESRLFGYPSFSQYDPRGETQFKDSSEPYELLFQLVSEKSVLWGDMGIGNFFIQPSALKKHDFSKVFYHWDCH